jgi:hypothetical protein
LFIQPQRARICDNKCNTNSAADALPLNLNLRRCCLIQQGCRPSSHPTSFSAEHESVTCLERIGKAGEKGMGQTNQELTFILAISSFSALVNLASICIRIENHVCVEKELIEYRTPPWFLLQLLARAFHAHIGTRIQPAKTELSI